MKRSEMIEILAEEIQGEYSWDMRKIRIPLEYAYQIAENVLDRAVKNGMVPPSMEWVIGGKTFRDNGWEREDG